MNDWKSRMYTLIKGTDNLSDNVRLRMRKIIGFDDPLIIIPYLGYGTADELLFGGRVLEDEGFTLARSADHTWRNLINMYKRFETDEVPGARIRVQFQGIESEVTTDDEGYFSFEIQPVRPLDSNQWQHVERTLGSKTTKRKAGARHRSGTGTPHNR
jgi:phosphatidate phosphatase APP1